MADALNDTGARTAFAGGGVRDTSEGKPRFDLLWPKDVPLDSQFLARMAHVLMLGAAKYDERNWELFHTPEAVAHAQASLGRHYAGYMAGDTSEDHLAMMGCNLLILASLEWKLANGWTPPAVEAEAQSDVEDHLARRPRKRRRVLADLERATAQAATDAAFVSASDWGHAQAASAFGPRRSGVPEADVPAVKPGGSPWTSPRNDGRPHHADCRWTHPGHPSGCLDDPGTAAAVSGDSVDALTKLADLRPGEAYSAAAWEAATPALRAAGVLPGSLVTETALKRAVSMFNPPSTCDNPKWHLRRGCRCFGD